MFCTLPRIDNVRLKELLLKHQVDCSAKNFTAREKAELTEFMAPELTEFMAPIARDFVRWVLTGSPDSNTNDVCIPTSFVKFKLTKPKDRYNINVARGDFDLISYEVSTIEDYIDYIMYKSNGALKPGGFSTGLSWTYATGSKGHKMQFKG